MEKEGVPLPAARLKRLHEDLDWEELPSPDPNPNPNPSPNPNPNPNPNPDPNQEIVWGPCFIRVRGAEYPVVRVQFMPHTTTA